MIDHHLRNIPRNKNMLFFVLILRLCDEFRDMFRFDILLSECFNHGPGTKPDEIMMLFLKTQIELVHICSQLFFQIGCNGIHEHLLRLTFTLSFDFS